jgi:uncharacterized DUF497 family protein
MLFCHKTVESFYGIGVKNLRGLNSQNRVRKVRNVRFNALGYIDNRLYHMTFTPRGGAMRVISLRKANNREVRKYAKT